MHLDCLRIYLNRFPLPLSFSTVSVNPKMLLLLCSLIEGKHKRIVLSYLLLSIAITLSKVLLMPKLVVSFTMMLYWLLLWILFITLMKITLLLRQLHYAMLLNSWDYSHKIIWQLVHLFHL